MKGQYLHKKRWLSILLSVSIGLSGIVAIKPETALAAQPHWADSAMTKMAQADILKGDTDGQMHPDRPITRAEFVSMLNRAFRYDSYKDEKLPFSDMTGKEWYADNIRVAYNQGYFSGITKNKAGARDPITREQAAAMLCRNLKVDSKALQVDVFTDGRKISQWSKGSIGASVDKKYIHGYKDGSFRPQANITRGEAAAMLSNSLGTVLSKGGVQSLGTVQGNVTISGYNTALEDTVITGDLYITEGVGMGYVKLHNVTVLGEVIVCGGGEGQWGGSSVEFDDCTVAKLTIHGPADRPVAVSAIHGTRIGVTNVKSHAYIENKSSDRKVFERINLIGEENTELHVAGFFRTVSIQKPKNVFLLGRGEVENLIVDEKGVNSKVILDRKTLVRNAKLDAACEISGAGDIGSVVVAANGVKIQMLPDEIEIRPGIIANINGKDMGSLDAAESTAFPKILAGYPSAEEIQATQAKMLLKTNKPGTLRWALTQSDAEELTKQDLVKPSMKASIKQSGTTPAEKSETEITFDVRSLKPDLEYVLSAMLVDDRGTQSVIKTEIFRTADNTKPDFQKGYPKLVPENSTTMLIDVVPTKDCKVFWAIFPKDRQAPTEYQLKKGEFDGALAFGKEENAKKNLSYRFTVTGLKEKEKYDIYVMASDGQNDSKIYKLTGETKDTTPPNFINNTPFQDKITDKTVDVKVEADEDGTVYYVVCEKGAIFPPPIPNQPGQPVKPDVKPDAKPEQPEGGQGGETAKPKPPKPQAPSLDSEAAQQAVITGNNAFKSGKISVKDHVQGVVKISGLEAQTPYDVYMVVVDRAKNVSKVAKVNIKTKDVIPPTAEMEFGDEIEGKFNAKTDLKIVFSEEVWSLITNQKLGYDENGKLAPEAENTLKQNISLHDTSEKKKDVYWNIDFGKVIVSEGEKGATVVTFPPESLDLNSGGKYQFELNEIVDTSGNVMKKGTLLKEFETVPPLVQLAKTQVPYDKQHPEKNMDLTFSIEPQSNKTADAILYDMIFGSDSFLKFNLFYRENSNEEFKNINAIFDPENKVDDYTPQIGEKEAITLHYMIDGEIEPDKSNELHYERFNELKPGEYGIQFVAINGQTDRDGWNKTVKMEIQCVSGSKDALDVMGGAPKKESYDQAIQEGMKKVNYPPHFVLQKTFSDRIVPEFMVVDEKDPNTDPNKEPANWYPKLETPPNGIATEEGTVADILIRPQIKATRKATMYYLIVPEGTIGEYKDKQQKLDAAAFQKELDKLKVDIMTGGKRPVGSVLGTYEIASGGTMYQPIIEGLTPKKGYDAFFVLKGTPPTPSKVYYRNFTTAEVAPPKLVATVTQQRESSALITVESDKKAKIDWIAMPASQTKEYIKDEKAGTVNNPIEMAKTIRNGKQIVGERAWYGTIFTGYSAGENNKQVHQALIDVKDLQPKTEYILFAVGKMQLSDGTVTGLDSDIVFTSRFTTGDFTGPELKNPVTTMISRQEVNDPQNGKYYGCNGTLTLSFTEPLFYRTNKSDDIQPVNKEVFEKALQISYGKPTISDFREDNVQIKEGTTVQALRSCKIAFNQVPLGAAIDVDLDFCDLSGNPSGTLRLILTDNPESKYPPDLQYRDYKWVGGFTGIEIN